MTSAAVDDHVDDLAARMAGQLVGVAGVVGVTLGGSRARGTHTPTSDLDLGVYYRGDLDVGAVRSLAEVWAPGRHEVAAPGGWGPWVDGGAWLLPDAGGSHETQGAGGLPVAVDWIYRDLDRVLAEHARGERGRVDVVHHLGHPLGFLTCAYPGELASARVLADTGDVLAAARARVATMPPALRQALADLAWQASFTLGVARKALPRGDTTYLAAAVAVAVGHLAWALHGRAGAWAVNEKGLVDAAGGLPGAPEGFAERAHALLAGVGRTPEELAATHGAATRLAEDTLAALAPGG